MIRQGIIDNLRELAISLGAKADGTEWHLFGSVDRNEANAADIDLMILCKSDAQADVLRLAIDMDALLLPLHLVLMSFEEAIGIDAIGEQRSRAVFP